MAESHEPDRASRSETYRGVEIDVYAYRQPSGRWTWTYIAGDLIGRMRGVHLPTAEAALTRGMLAARSRLDP